MNRAVIYARFSSDMQRLASLEDQIRLCRERVVADGRAVVGVFSDRAMSGATLLRPGFQDLLAQAASGAFDFVYAEALDRLSRDQEDVAAVFKRMQFAEVKIITLAEGEITELHVGLKGTMNALFLKDLADKTRRGLRGRVEAGRSAGGKSFGYDIPLTLCTAEGTRETGMQSINATEADIVRRIFRDYAHGRSPRAIAKALNRASVPGPSGGPWGPSTINGNVKRGTGILNNELYVGIRVWNRLRYLKDPTTGRRRSRLNPSSDWIVREVPDLRIVSDGEWNSVKLRQDELKHRPRLSCIANNFWTKQRPRYLLSGLMKCGMCGASYTKIGKNRFSCAGHKDRASCENGLTIRCDEIEGAVMSGLKSRLMNPDLFEAFAKEFLAEVNRQRNSISDIRRDIERRLQTIDRQIANLVNAICAGADALPLNARLQELEAEKDVIATELSDAPVGEPLIHPALATVYRQHVEQLETLLQDDETRNEAFQLLRSLIDEVRLTPQEGNLLIELRGQLAGIIGISDKGKTSASREQNALQIKMVAGAGFEPTTFRL